MCILLNNIHVNMGLKDVAQISRLRIVKVGFKPNAMEEQTFKDRFFRGLKQVSYQEINQAVFISRLIKRVRTKDEGMNM